MENKMKLQEINFLNVDKTLKSPEYKNIIYGAGRNGEYLLKLLDQQGVLVTAFYDDDRQRGNNYCGRTILSETELKLLVPDSTNIIISSMYIPQIYQKCKKLGFERIFVALEKILEKDTAAFRFAQYVNDEYIARLDRLGDYFKQDTLSQKYFAVIKKAVLAGRAVKDIVELYCREKQYFLNCFRGKLSGLNFIDAGAYTGDTLRESEVAQFIVI